MNIQEINQLTHESVSRLTSDEYKDAFNSPETGKAFAEKINALDSQPRQATRKAGNVRGEQAPEPQSSGFDPSFDGDEEQPAPAAAPVAVEPAAEPMPRDKMSVWSYQPRDSQNRPVGGEQRFFYDPSLPIDDPKSLASQLTKAHSCATSALKEKKTREYIDSMAVNGGYVEPKMLTALDHPEYEKLNAITRTAFNNAVQGALSLFKQRNPSFTLSDSNAAAMCRWVEKNHLDPADGASWEASWQALRPHLLPDEVEVVAPAPTPVAAPVPKAPAVRPANTYRLATGFSNADSTSTNDPFEAQPTKVVGVRIIDGGKTTVMTLGEWNKLASDTQKRILRSSANTMQIEALYEAADAAKAARIGRQ